jgi:hypothetical protein
MATITETPVSTPVKPSHEYHADAHVLSGQLHRPIEQKIERQAPVTIKDRRGGHLTRFTEAISIEGLIAFGKGETRVSGSRSLKNNGWVTLSTSILEELNVFEVITAERVVSQVSTDHPYDNGHFPSVSFLGTQFRDLRVSGFEVALTLNLGFCGPKPAGDQSYFQDGAFLSAVQTQTSTIANKPGLPKALKDEYDQKLTYINSLISSTNAAEHVHAPITCSLVQSIGKIPIPGVEAFGHILVIPEFGTVALGEIEIGERQYDPSERPCVYFELSALRMKLGCVGDGTTQTATAAANGRHYP